VRKLAAFILILSANIILLAHAVIPHHHDSHSQHHDEGTVSDHRHDVPCHDHERKGSQGEEAFILDEEMLLRFNHERQSIIFAKIQDNFLSQYQIIGIISRYKPIEYLPVLISDASIPLIASSYICFAESSGGLRAPPSI
jgi:hypothetical protein